MLDPKVLRLAVFRRKDEPGWVIGAWLNGNWIGEYPMADHNIGIVLERHFPEVFAAFRLGGLKAAETALRHAEEVLGSGVFWHRLNSAKKA